MVKQIRIEKTGISQIKNVLRINHKDLSQGNLIDYQILLREYFKNDYSSTLVIIRSNFDKEFVFFIPNRLEETYDSEITGDLLAFYWINDDQLVTTKNSFEPEFSSNSKFV